MSKIREIKEGMQYQGADETIVYTLTTTPWGATPTSTAAAIFTVVGDTYTNLTTTCMTGATSVVGDVITLPSIHTLTAGTLYRVEVLFTSSGNVFEAIALIKAER
jgi:hypothetical protein